MHNIDINKLTQHQLARYYSGWWKCAVADGSQQSATVSNKLCLVEITDSVDETLIVNSKANVDGAAFGIALVYLPFPENGDWTLTDKQLVRVFEQYNCVGLFCGLVGHQRLNFVTINRHFIESRKIVKWAYNFFDGASNLTPPLPPPSVNINDVDKFIMCALSMEATPGKNMILSQSILGSGDGQVWNMGVDYVETSYCDKPIISMSHPETENYVSLRHAYLTDLTGKSIEELKDESEDFERL